MRTERVKTRELKVGRLVRKRARKTKVKEKRALSTETWTLDEVSTRNCRHCLAWDVFVRCRKGHSMVGEYSRHKRQLTYNGVITAPRLLKPCRGCEDFVNDWS